MVADASALMEYLLGTTRSAPVEAVVTAADTDIHVPSLCDVEVAAVLRRGLLAGSLEPGRARQALEDYLDLPITRHGHGGLLDRVLELRENFSAYDAVYAALAERMEAALLTADRRLARGARSFLRIRTLPVLGKDAKEAPT